MSLFKIMIKKKSKNRNSIISSILNKMTDWNISSKRYIISWYGNLSQISKDTFPIWRTSIDYFPKNLGPNNKDTWKYIFFLFRNHLKTNDSFEMGYCYNCNSTVRFWPSYDIIRPPIQLCDHSIVSLPSFLKKTYLYRLIAGNS